MHSTDTRDNGKSTNRGNPTITPRQRGNSAQRAKPGGPGAWAAVQRTGIETWWGWGWQTPEWGVEGLSRPESSSAREAGVVVGAEKTMVCATPPVIQVV